MPRKVDEKICKDIAEGIPMKLLTITMDVSEKFQQKFPQAFTKKKSDGPPKAFYEEISGRILKRIVQGI